MLAYVFWHWPDAAVSKDTYEALLVAFHQALALLGPAPADVALPGPAGRIVVTRRVLWPPARL